MSRRPQVAERLCEEFRVDRDRSAQRLIVAYPAGTPDQELVGRLIIDERLIRLAVSD